MHHKGAMVQENAPICLLNTTGSNFLQIGNVMQLLAAFTKFTTETSL
jgi:hypothetical protein